jgi:hypothetical protein
MGRHNHGEERNFPKAILLAGLVALLAPVTTARAADQASAAPPAALESFAPAVGRWACDNRTLGEGAHAYGSTAQFSRELDGRAYIWRWQETGSTEHPTPNETVELIMFDPDTKRVVTSGMSRFGPIKRIGDGWVGNRLTWEADGYRIVGTRKVPGEDLSYVVEVPKDGRWVTVVEGTCRKQ